MKTCRTCKFVEKTKITDEFGLHTSWYLECNNEDCEFWGEEVEGTAACELYEER